MRTRQLAAIGFASCILFAGATGTASACSCGDPNDSAERLLKASDVVRARVTEVKTGDETMIEGHAFVRADLKIVETVKGDVRDRATVVTGFGTGDCGQFGLLVASVMWRRDVTLELRRVPEMPDVFAVDICGYWKYDDPAGNNR